VANLRRNLLPTVKTPSSRSQPFMSYNDATKQATDPRLFSIPIAMR
jgi:hypothetical protein